MSAYANLTPAVRAVVDRQAEAYALRHGVTLDVARDAIAEAVTTVTTRGDTGTGH